MPDGATLEREDAQALEAGRLLFARPCGFVLGVANLAQLPDAGLPEVAFAGRSNVGKSSLINALTNRSELARTSRTPGRTQQLNMFDLGGRLVLVDLPGYGYAKAPKAAVASWNRLLRDYLRGRSVLRRACVLIDARHGIKDLDRDFMTMLGEAAVAFQAVLTKVDQVRGGERASLVAGIGRALAGMPGAHPEVLRTSARDGLGVERLRATLAGLAAREEER
jgi:GTP-binding protein